MGTHPIFESDFDCLTVQLLMRLILSKAQFAAFVPRVIEIVKNAQTKRKSLITPFCGDGEALKPALDHLEKALAYNLVGGKMTRGLMAAEIYYALLIGQTDSEGELSRDQLETGLRLGWAVECLQTAFLMADDIMDKSETRRGVPCWYKKVGLTAINDLMTIDSCVYSLLRSLPSSLPVNELVELFSEVTLITEQGQTLDMQNSELPEVDLSKFTRDNYSAIVKYKTAVYSFYLPFASGMLAAGHAPDCETMRQILLEMGHYFQVQDDFLDCFGDPAVTGKIGTDIQDNKCSWMIVTALEHMSVEDRQLVKKHYGKSGVEDVATIKALYTRLEVSTIFARFEEESYKRIEELINTYRGPLDPAIFHLVKAKIYKRNK